jgi:hypothetical protein
MRLPLRLPEDEFAATMRRVLSPSHAIQTPELLKGRDEQLREIQKAWYQGGRQIFIYGFRGVGKTSLAQTAAFQHQSSDGTPILLTCGEESTFVEIVHDIFTQAFPSDPRIIKEKLDSGVGAKLGGLTAEVRQSIEAGRPPEPKTLNEAVQIMDFVSQFHSKEPVVIIDEFDLLKSKQEQAKFAGFVKQLADSHVRAKLIFCGIGESVDEFFGAHESTYRYFHTVKLDRLAWEPRFQIIQTAADALNIAVDDTTRTRIARVSDGFPHFIHLVCEKLFWEVYESNDPMMRASGDHYERAVEKAVAEIAPYLKKPYEKATRKYTNDYEHMLWAVADNHQLLRPSREIYDSYVRIIKSMGKEPLDRTQFHNRMNNMKKAPHGEILIGSRTGWYEFREKMMRGYARLRATQEGVELDAEHPLQPRRLAKPA